MTKSVTIVGGAIAAALTLALGGCSSAPIGQEVLVATDLPAAAVHTEDFSDDATSLDAMFTKTPAGFFFMDTGTASGSLSVPGTDTGPGKGGGAGQGLQAANYLAQIGNVSESNAVQSVKSLLEDIEGDLTPAQAGTGHIHPLKDTRFLLATPNATSLPKLAAGNTTPVPTLVTATDAVDNSYFGLMPGAVTAETVDKTGDVNVILSSPGTVYLLLLVPLANGAGQVAAGVPYWVAAKGNAQQAGAAFCADVLSDKFSYLGFTTGTGANTYIGVVCSVVNDPNLGWSVILGVDPIAHT